MKFLRRPDLDPHTRIEMVKLAWLHQGIYGKMTQIAQDYHISRTFLYQLTWAAQHQLETLFSTPTSLAPGLQSPLEPLMLLLRLEAACSLPSLSSILKRLEYQPNSVGYLSESLQAYGRAVPSTLSMSQQTVVFYLSDEIFAIRHPILVTIEAHSTAILKIELASDRSAETWQAHFADLGAHRFHSIGMASDRGGGLTAGSRAACQEGFWVGEQFHEFQDLFHRCHQLQRQASGAIGKEIEAAEKCANAKSEANLQKRLKQYAQAPQVCEQAIARYDQLDLLLHLLSDTLPFCSDTGRLRTVEAVRADLSVILSLMQEIDDEKLPKLLTSLRSHLDDICVPFRQVESVHAELLEFIPQPIIDAFVLAGHHDHLSYQAHGKKKHYHRRECEYWLDFSEALLDEQFDGFKMLVFEKLDAIVKASSLVEMVNSLIRPYLNSSKGQITQETLNLIMFYHNHRRYKGGKRQGKAPIELLTGEVVEADWVDLLIQHKQETSPDAPVAPTPSLTLVPHGHEGRREAETPAHHVALEANADSPHPWQAVAAEAA